MYVSCLIYAYINVFMYSVCTVHVYVCVCVCVCVRERERERERERDRLEVMKILRDDDCVGISAF